MKQRTKDINKAILQAKIRDNYICQVCLISKETGSIIEGAHIICRNNGFKKWNPANDDNIITMCFDCHLRYDRKHDNESKYKFLIDNNLEKYAMRVKEIVGL